MALASGLCVHRLRGMYKYATRLRVLTVRDRAVLRGRLNAYTSNDFNVLKEIDAAFWAYVQC